MLVANSPSMLALMAIVVAALSGAAAAFYLRAQLRKDPPLRWFAIAWRVGLVGIAVVVAAWCVVAPVLYVVYE